MYSLKSISLVLCLLKRCGASPWWIRHRSESFECPCCSSKWSFRGWCSLIGIPTRRAPPSPRCGRASWRWAQCWGHTPCRKRIFVNLWGNIWLFCPSGWCNHICKAFWKASSIIGGTEKNSAFWGWRAACWAARRPSWRFFAIVRTWWLTVWSRCPFSSWDFFFEINQSLNWWYLPIFSGGARPGPSSVLSWKMRAFAVSSRERRVWTFKLTVFSN